MIGRPLYEYDDTYHYVTDFFCRNYPDRFLGESVRKNKKVLRNMMVEVRYMEEMTKERIIWDFLVDRIGNMYGAAALMGNLYAESGLQGNVLEYKYHESLGFDSDGYTAAVNSGSYGNFSSDGAGYGLAQWTLRSRKENLLNYAKEKNVSIGDISMQLEYLWMELNTEYTLVLEKLKNTDSIQNASDTVLTDFENPWNQNREVKLQRAAYGKRFFYRYISPEQLDEELQMLSRWRDDISFLLMDYLSGEVIYQRNANCLRPIGSIAKLMTAYVMMDKAFHDKSKLREVVTIDKETAEMSCNREFSGGECFAEGEQFEAERLFELLLVNSSCSSTFALVKHFFCSKESFIDTMNDVAKRIGINAHFEDIIGVSPYNSCSALDTAKLGRTMIRDYPEILTYTSMKNVVIKGIIYPNSNRFVSGDYFFVQGVDGLKTGTTLCAGRCHLATAKRGDRRVISVVLGALEKKELYDETTGLLEYGLERGK